MLLLCQDLTLENSMRLWDSLLSAEGELTEGKYLRFQFIDFIAVALVQGVSEKIIENDDFSSCM